MKRQLGLLFLFVFVDILGFSLILPLLPYYAKSFGATPVVVGLLLSANAVTQLLGAPLIGRLSDRYGRRPLLLLCILGTVAGFLLLGFANSLALLFISRIVDGFLGGNISLAQAYITDVTDEQNRAKGMGLIGAAFGLGFIIGPAMGGLLSQGENYALPAFLAAGLAALNLVGVWLWLPESLSPERRAALRNSPRTAFTARALFNALRRKCVGPLLNLRLFYGLAFTMFETVFSLYAIARLKLNAQETSYVLTYVGVIVVILQGGAIGALTKRFSEKTLTFWGVVLLSASLLGWALAPTLWALLVVLIPLSLASGVLNIVTNSLLTKVVYQEEVGGTLGLSAALASFARIISPSLGGWLIQSLGAWAPGALGAVIVAALIPYTRRYLAALPDEPGPSCAEAVGLV
ncbi:MAG TPA: MFS transporter [Anaerolineae bacterium]|nr:MFS transporter [Anaerolineae bacterium]